MVIVLGLSLVAHGTVPEVLVFGSDGSLGKGLACVSVQF